MEKTTTTAQALLGLLSIRSWTAYELTQQMQRALRWAWPRSEAGLYSEIKGLAPKGLAEPIEETVGGRTRTRYQITKAGRAEVESWLQAPLSSPPQVQFEALLRVFLADQGTPEDLQQTMETTRDQLVASMEEAIPILEEYLGDDAPFPERSHLNALFIHFFAGFFDHVLKWCDEVETEMLTWSGTTTDVGLTPGTRKMLEDAMHLYGATIEEHQQGRGV